MRRYENVKLEKLKAYEKNARVHREKQVQKIADSISEFGFVNPVLIDENYMVIAGHGRLMAVEKLAITEVPCIFIEDLTEVQKKAYIIADNKLAEDASWNMELLGQELSSLKDLDFNIELTGFTLDDINFDFEEIEIVEDEVPEVRTSPKARLGDIYQLGRHRLMCGDSTNLSDVEKLMNGEKADLLLTDPPYNVDYTGKSKDLLKIDNDKMPEEKFREFLKRSFCNADRAMRAGAAFYIWHSDSEGHIFRTACTDVGWKIRKCLIWNKNSMVLGRHDYHWKHEPCLYGWKDGAGHLWAINRNQKNRKPGAARRPKSICFSGRSPNRGLAAQPSLGAARASRLNWDLNTKIGFLLKQTTVIDHERPSKSAVPRP